MNYDLVLSLEKFNDTFEGRLKLSFLISQSILEEDLEGLFLDFHGKSILELVINGTPVEPHTISF